MQPQQHAVMAMALVAEPDSVIYFTDTSVNPDRGKTGAAAITSTIQSGLTEVSVK